MIGNKKNPPFTSTTRSAVLRLYRTIEILGLTEEKKSIKTQFLSEQANRGMQPEYSVCNCCVMIHTKLHWIFRIKHQLGFAELCSALDILDDILKLFFCVHVKGLARLYCGKLQAEIRKLSDLQILFKFNYISHDQHHVR